MDQPEISELELSNALDILEVLMVPLIISRPSDDWIMFANAEASELTGYSKTELMGKKYSQLLFPDEMSKFKNLMQLAKTSNMQEDRLKLQRKSQRTIQTKIKVRMIENEDLFLTVLLTDEI